MAYQPEEELEPGSQAWWRQRKKASRTASRENLAEVSGYVSLAKDQGPEYHALVRQITANYQSDFRTHQVAAARATLGDVPGVSDHLALCDDMLEAWCDIRMLSPEGLLKWKATLLRQQEMAIQFAKGVADGPMAVPPEATTVEIEVTTPEDRASYAAKLTAYTLLDVKRRALRQERMLPVEDAEVVEVGSGNGASSSE